MRGSGLWVKVISPQRHKGHKEDGKARRGIGR
jgi:hypothetical protein